MKINKKLTTILSFVVVAVAAVVFIFNVVKAGPLLTAQQANQIVLSEHAGEVLDTKLDGSDYIVTLKTVKGIYQFLVPQHKGQITSITQLENFVVNSGQNSESKGIEDKEVKDNVAEALKPQQSMPIIADTVIDKDKNQIVDSQATLLNESQIKEIALAQVVGEIDGLNLIQNDATKYYLVEVEVESGQDAVVQIHAVTGKVMSITWDDDDNTDD